MQSTSKEIYKITAARTGRDEQVYKDIGTFIQKETAEQLKKPKSLIIKLKGIGFWFLRKARMEKTITYYPPNYDKTFEDFDSERDFLNAINKREMYELFKARLEEYDRFLEAKKLIKEKKHEYTQLLEEQKNSTEASEGNA